MPPSGAPSEVVSPSAAAAAEETAQQPLDIRTKEIYDAERGILRTDLDAPDLELELFYEIPVFEETGEGYGKINQFFEEKRAEFFSPENENLITALDMAANYPAGDGVGYEYGNTAVVHLQTEELVSVSINYEWYMGGVQDYGSDSYTFRTDTGEQLRLTDLVEGTEEELKEEIVSLLEEQDGGQGELSLGNLRERPLEEFEFAVCPDGVWIFFDKYEIAAGAAGGFSVKLEAERKDCWTIPAPEGHTISEEL